MSAKIISVGEVLWDIFPDGKKLGGAPANFAYIAASLGLESSIISAIGNDALGENAIKLLRKKGVNTIFTRTPYPTGTVNVSINNYGIPTYDIKENVAWDHILYLNEAKDVVMQAQCISFGTLAQRSPISHLTIKKILENTPMDAYKVFDINLRQNYYTPGLLAESFSLCNILKINDDELDIISNFFNINGSNEEKCRKLLALYGWKILILTCGEKGSYVFTPNKTLFKETPKVKVLDTVGAGDAFCAAFCSAILKGYFMEEAHNIAVEVAAYVCTQSGAMPMWPKTLRI